ncbi:MAG: O-antigen ligase family protein [Deltaproteobacteria bacterium]|nr:O-antigen ligase family protein [Deltaproteobacteria bacterium]
MNKRVVPLVVFALVLLRMALPAHAPAAVDAHLALAALVLARAQAPSRATLVAAGLLVLGGLVAVPWSWHPLLSALALPVVVGPAAFLLIGGQTPTRSGALWGLAVGGAANAVAATVQRFWTWPELLARSAADLDATVVGRLTQARALGLSLSPDLCGALCIAGGCAAAVLALEAPYRERRLAPIVLALVSLGGVVVVRSFGSALALGAGAALAVGLVLSRRASRAVLVATLGGVAMAALALVGALASRGTDALAGSAAERLANWRIALDVAGLAPVTGVGLARFPAAYLLERTPDANLTRYAHSGPLQWLAEGGALGALLVAGAVVVAALALWRRRAVLPASSLVLVAGAVALFARTLIDYDAQVAQTASVLALLVGLTLAGDESAAAPLAVHRRVTLAATVLLVPVVVLAFWRDGALAEQRDDARLRTWLQRLPGDAEAQVALGARAVDRLYACAEPAACTAAHGNALAALDAAAVLPHPSSAVFVLRARVQAHAGALELAERDVDTALALNPGSAPAHQLAVELARAQGDDPAARLEAAAAWRVAVP